MKNILITGAAGFIGSHLCEFYLNKNCKVIGVDNLITGNKQNVSHLLNNVNFKFIEHDICKKLELNEKIDVILHFASPASPKNFIKYSMEILDVGSIGTKNILELAYKNNSKFLLASTSEVYGDPLEHPQNESYFGNVNTIGPRSVYDESKRFSESLTYTFKRKFNLDIRIIRIFNTYGPRMRKNDGRVIPNFINQLIQNKHFTIYGDGLQTRSFCYIDDLIVGIDLALECNYNEPINLGNPKEYTILELVDLVKKIKTNNNKIIFKKIPEDDPKNRKPDITLATKLFKWKPRVNLSDGLKKTFDYYK